MIFEGSTLCPACGLDISFELRDVLRKAEDDAIYAIECPRCGTNIRIFVYVRHRIHMIKD